MIRRIFFVMLSLIANVLCISLGYAQEQFPIVDKVAQKVIQKYQQESCPQLAAQRDQPKGPAEQRAIQLLHDDPQMRRAFIDRVAAPIANKLFECGLIP
jgi:hypothetical protein